MALPLKHRMERKSCDVLFSRDKTIEHRPTECVREGILLCVGAYVFVCCVCARAWIHLFTSAEGGPLVRVYLRLPA